METRRRKIEIGSLKLKPNVGTLEKPGRKTTRKTRESESLHNIVDGKQETIMDFTPKKLL